MLPLGHPPPRSEQKALPGGVPEDLSQDNLSMWAGIVQDVSVGMIVPQPGTDQIIFPQVVEILTLLESASRVTFCRQCYLPGSACRCLGSSSTTSTASTTGLSWSEVANPTYSPKHGICRERRRDGASIWVVSHGRRLHLGSAFHGFPRAPRSSFRLSPTTPPCWERRFP